VEFQGCDSSALIGLVESVGPSVSESPLRFLYCQRVTQLCLILPGRLLGLILCAPLLADL
jgi:hypothetical protein